MSGLLHTIAMQEDNHMATMTVSETMNFHADIILPKTWTKLDRRARVAEVLAHMGLAHKHKTMVGGTLPGGLMLRGLSGGERKRLSIAAGILAAPGVVFLDEPTSGLDSFAALTVMGHLKKMACDNGHVVIASIHQPRTAIWSMFDKVPAGTGNLLTSALAFGKLTLLCTLFNQELEQTPCQTP
jgi:ABC-type multidrug transport system ATPase subunit